jgi:hypothetical protein
MDYKKETSAVCLSDIKQAALFFDRVYPVVYSEFVEKTILSKDKAGNLSHKEFQFKSDIHKKVFFDLMLGTPNPSNEMHNKIVSLVSLWRLLLYGLLHYRMKEKYSEFIVKTLETNLSKKRPLDTTDIHEVADIIATEIGNPDVALVQDKFNK